MALSVTESIITAVICLTWVGLIAYLLPFLREPDLSNPRVPSPRCEGCPVWAFLRPVRSLGATIMSVVDDALARLTAFVKGVLDQVKSAKDANDAQTGKLAELQAALDAATANDATDQATIAALKAEVDTLQASVAAQINAAVDALENPPVVEAPAADTTVPGPVVVDVAADPAAVVTDAPVE